MRGLVPLRYAAPLLAAVALCAAAPAGALSELSSQVTGEGCAGVSGSTSATLGPCVISGLSSEARAAAAFGHLEAFYKISGTSTGTPAAGVGGNVFVSYRDTITFQPMNPSLNGTAGTVTFTFGLSGTVSTTIPAGTFSAFARLTVENQNAPFQTATPVNAFFAPPSSLTFDAPFTTTPMDIVWGVPVDFKTQITLGTGVPAGFVGPLLIVLDFEGSLNLDSIEGLDESGGAVAFSVSSESGTEYPGVPEPSEAVLLLVGAIALAGIRRGQALTGGW
jgi:hypothetical protein